MCRSKRVEAEPLGEISNNGSGNFLSIEDIPDVVRDALKPIRAREQQYVNPLESEEANSQNGDPEDVG